MAQKEFRKPPRYMVGDIVYSHGFKEVDIGDYSDWEMIDGKHYCPDCYEVEVIDGVYNVKAKEK